MLHLHDRAAMARALTLKLEPRLRRLLGDRIVALRTVDGDLTDWTEYLVVEPGDTEADVARAIGSAPTVDPVSGARFGEPGFAPHWDWLAAHDGWFEMILTFGGGFAYVLFVADAEGVAPDLLRLCRFFAGTRD